MILPSAQSNISVSIAPRSTLVENVVHPVGTRPQLRVYLDGSFDRVKGKGGCAAVLLSPAVHGALSSASIGVSTRSWRCSEVDCEQSAKCALSYRSQPTEVSFGGSLPSISIIEVALVSVLLVVSVMRLDHSL